MASSKNMLCSFSLVMIICSLFFVGKINAQAPGGGSTQLPCIQKLLPCQPFLKQPSNPPASCCIPLKELVANDKPCLCQVFNNPLLLKGLNITQHDALQLSDACHANADPSVCKTEGAPPTASPPPSASNSSSKSNSTASPPSKNAAGVGVEAHFGVIAFLFFILLSIMA